MVKRIGGMFAGRGIPSAPKAIESGRNRARQAKAGLHLPPRNITLAVVGGAFVLGIGGGWVSTLAPQWFGEGSLSASSPSASATPQTTVSIDIPEVIRVDREMDLGDEEAGLTDLAIDPVGSGALATVSGLDSAMGSGPVRWVRVESEVGLPVNVQTYAAFVMNTLNNDQGWGANGRMQFARTDGAAEIRVILATPGTAQTLCSYPHLSKEEQVSEADLLARQQAAGETPAPSDATELAGIEPSDEILVGCAHQGMIVLDANQWVAGLSAFLDDRDSARRYLITHFVGHALGEFDNPTPCAREGESLSVMFDQTSNVGICKTEIWPHPAPPVEEEN